MLIFPILPAIIDQYFFQGFNVPNLYSAQPVPAAVPAPDAAFQSRRLSLPRRFRLGREQYQRSAWSDAAYPGQDSAGADLRQVFRFRQAERQPHSGKHPRLWRWADWLSGPGRPVIVPTELNADELIFIATISSSAYFRYPQSNEKARSKIAFSYTHP